MKPTLPAGTEGRRDREMTVAHLREQAGEEFVMVVFLESARFYRLSRQNPDFQLILDRFRAALARGERVRIRVAAPDGDLIEAAG